MSLVPLDQSSLVKKDTDTLPQLLSAFVALYGELLGRICLVFPECNKSEQALKQFEEKKNSLVFCESLCKRWHENLKEYYVRCSNRDLNVMFENIPIFIQLEIGLKLQDPELSEESKQNLWSYIQSLNSYANIFCQIPSSMRGKLETYAQKLGNDIKNGTMTLDQLNLGEIGQEMMSQISEEELVAFASNAGDLTKNMANMGGLFSLFGANGSGLMNLFNQSN